MSEENIVRFGAPTLAGLKTGSLFVCGYDSRQRLRCEVRSVNRTLFASGIRLRVMRLSRKRALLYLYRPALLERDLRDPEALNLLRRPGTKRRMRRNAFGS